MKKIQALTLAIVMALSSSAALAEDGEYVISPKVSNFDVLLDYSGSMAMKYSDMSEAKIAMAKEIISEINSKIPDFDINGALHTFAPNTDAVSFGTWDRASYADGIASVEDDYEIFGRITPMNQGLDQALPAIQGMDGKTAVIIVSDGEANRGPSPLDAAKAIAGLENVCLYTISLADTPQGQATMDAIGALSSCGGSFTGMDLLDSSSAMNTFVEEVFVERTFVPAPVEEAIVLRNVTFALNSSTLNSEAIEILDQVAEIIKAHPEKSVVITGHTDNTGPAAYNQTLSVARATSVLDYLSSMGIEADRMTAVGDGDADPQFNNDTLEGRKLNRRVEITLD